MKIKWKQEKLYFFGKYYSFRECKDVALRFSEQFVLEHKTRSEGKNIYTDWRTIFYSPKFRRMMSFYKVFHD